MKALVKVDVGEGHVCIHEVDKPQITEDDEVEIRVEAAGICGTDINILHGKDTLFHPPVVMGHEFSGEVGAVGTGVHKFARGDRVVFEPTVQICGTCRFCRSSRYNLCPDRSIAGFHAPGGFAEYAVRSETYVHRLPGNVGYVAGALSEPLAACCHAVLELTSLSPGDVVVVVGPGTIGLLSLQLVNTAGASCIVVGTQNDAARLDLAKNLGAEHVVNIDEGEENVLNLIHDLTEGYGADAVIGCCGASSSFRAGIRLLRKGGQYTQIGLFDQEVAFPIDTMSYHELTLRGSFSQKNSAWEKALSLLGRGLVNTLSLATVLPMSNWEEGFRMAENKKAVKVVLKP